MNGVQFKRFVFHKCCKHEQIITACFDCNIFARWFFLAPYCALYSYLSFFYSSYFTFFGNAHFATDRVVGEWLKRCEKRTATTEIEYERKTTVFRINLVDVTVRCYYDALFVPNIRNEHFVTCTMFCACLSKYNANARPTNDDGNVFVLNSINITTFSFFVCIFLFHFCLHYLVAWLCSVGLFFLLVLLG